MISTAYPATSWFLWLGGLAFFLGAALPLLLVPMRSGQAFGWKPAAGDGFTPALKRIQPRQKNLETLMYLFLVGSGGYLSFQLP
ncbi:MAG: hypothetical protein ACLFR7_02275 [Opitutales bacterium]